MFGTKRYFFFLSSFSFFSPKRKRQPSKAAKAWGVQARVVPGGHGHIVPQHEVMLGEAGGRGLQGRYFANWAIKKQRVETWNRELRAG